MDETANRPRFLYPAIIVMIVATLVCLLHGVASVGLLRAHDAARWDLDRNMRGFYEGARGAWPGDAAEAPTWEQFKANEPLTSPALRRDASKLRRRAVIAFALSVLGALTAAVGTLARRRRAA